jgi:hypothetical protein
MLSDPDWYKQQGQQARALANQASAYLSYLTSGEGRALPPAIVPLLAFAAILYCVYGEVAGVGCARGDE